MKKQLKFEDHENYSLAKTEHGFVIETISIEGFKKLNEGFIIELNNAMEAKQYIRIDDMELLLNAAGFASKDITRPNLMHIRIRKNGLIESTDGHVLFRNEYKHDEFFKADSKEVLIHSDVIRSIEKKYAKNNIGIAFLETLKYIVVQLNNKQIYFQEKYLGKFPDTDPFFNGKAVQFTKYIQDMDCRGMYNFTEIICKAKKAISAYNNNHLFEDTLNGTFELSIVDFKDHLENKKHENDKLIRIQIKPNIVTDDDAIISLNLDQKIYSEKYAIPETFKFGMNLEYINQALKAFSFGTKTNYANDLKIEFKDDVSAFMFSNELLNQKVIIMPIKLND